MKGWVLLHYGAGDDEEAVNAEVLQTVADRIAWLIEDDGLPVPDRIQVADELDLLLP